MTERGTLKNPRQVWDWTEDAEPGEIVIYRGQLCRLEESRGRHKRDAGILTPVPLKRDQPALEEQEHG